MEVNQSYFITGGKNALKMLRNFKGKHFWIIHAIYPAFCVGACCVKVSVSISEELDSKIVSMDSQTYLCVRQAPYCLLSSWSSLLFLLFPFCLIWIDGPHSEVWQGLWCTSTWLMVSKDSVIAVMMTLNHSHKSLLSKMSKCFATISLSGWKKSKRGKCNPYWKIQTVTQKG